MLNQSFAGASVAGNDIDDAGGQTDFLTDLGEGQRGDGSELGGLENNRVAGGHGRSDLPGKHEKWKIPRNHLPYHAAGFVAAKLLLEKLRPSGVVIEVSGDQGNIDVTTLANWLAIIEGFKHCKTTRVLLDLPGEGVEITRPSMRREGIPGWEGGAGRLYRRVDVFRAALRDADQLVSGRRIVGIKIFTLGGSLPCAIDEVPELAFMTIQPEESFLGIFQRRAVFHGSEFFRDFAHSDS